MPRPSYFQQIAGGPDRPGRLAPPRVRFRPPSLPTEVFDQPVAEVAATPRPEAPPIRSEPARQFEPPRVEPARRPERVEAMPGPFAPIVPDPPRPPVVGQAPSRQVPASIVPRERPAPAPPVDAPIPVGPRPRPPERIAERPAAFVAPAEFVAPAVRSAGSPVIREQGGSPVPWPRSQPAPASPPAVTSRPAPERFPEATPRPVVEPIDARPRPKEVPPAEEPATRRPAESDDSPRSGGQGGSPTLTPIRLEPRAVAPRPHRPSDDEPSGGVRIGSLEVRITPPAPTAPPVRFVGPARPAAIKPAATRLSRGFRPFGLVQG
jgi:hypothetical protein